MLDHLGGGKCLGIFWEKMAWWMTMLLSWRWAVLSYKLIPMFLLQEVSCDTSSGLITRQIWKKKMKPFHISTLIVRNPHWKILFRKLMLDMRFNISARTPLKFMAASRKTFGRGPRETRGSSGTSFVPRLNINWWWLVGFVGTAFNKQQTSTNNQTKQKAKHKKNKLLTC